MKKLLIFLLFFGFGNICFGQNKIYYKSQNMFKTVDSLLRAPEMGIRVLDYQARKFKNHSKNPVDGKNIFLYALPQDTCLQLETTNGPAWIRARKGDLYRTTFDKNGGRVIRWKDDCGNPVWQVYTPPSSFVQKKEVEKITSTPTPTTPQVIVISVPAQQVNSPLPKEDYRITQLEDLVLDLKKELRDRDESNYSSRSSYGYNYQDPYYYSSGRIGFGFYGGGYGYDNYSRVNNNYNYNYNYNNHPNDETRGNIRPPRDNNYGGRIYNMNDTGGQIRPVTQRGGNSGGTSVRGGGGTSVRGGSANIRGR